ANREFGHDGVASATLTIVAVPIPPVRLCFRGPEQFNRALRRRRRRLPPEIQCFAQTIYQRGPARGIRKAPAAYRRLWVAWHIPAAIPEPALNIPVAHVH